MSTIVTVLAILGSLTVLPNTTKETGVLSHSVAATNIEISERYEVLNGATPAVNTSLTDKYSYLGGAQPGIEGVLKNVLLDIYKDFDPAYDGQYICTNMFQNFTKLDLSNINYGSSEAINFNDFNHLLLSNLTELNLSNNSINEFDLTLLPAITYDEENQKYVAAAGSPANTLINLNLANNNIAGELDCRVLIELRNLNIANNKITKVQVNTNLINDCYLDYRNNKIEGIDSLTLPTNANTTLILYGNPFVSTAEFGANITVEVGLFNVAEVITSETRIKFIAFNSLPININIYTKKVENEVTTFTQYNYNPNSLTNFEFSLPAGNYKIEYVDGGTSEVINAQEVKVEPASPKYYFDIKGDKYDSYNRKVSRDAYVCFNMDKEGNIINPNATIYYRYSNSSDWIEGNKADLTKRKGSYILYYKAVENGIESSQGAIMVQSTRSKIIPDVMIVLFIIVFIVVLAVVVVPLIRKFLDKISK